MTNNELIKKEIQGTFTRSQIHDLFLAYYPGRTVEDPEMEALLVSDLFHTFAEWKQRGMSVKQGEKAIFKNVQLWKCLPHKAADSDEPLKDENGQEIKSGRFIMVPAHLFSISQVERTAPRASASSSDLLAYNRYLSAQRKAGAAPLGLAAWKSQQAVARA